MRNLYEISILINGKRGDSLVDTGRACIVMHLSVARELGIATRVIADAFLRMFAEQTMVANKVA
jgi:predicted aspartyl protease